MTDDKEKTMSIFSTPTDLGSDAMMKNVEAMTDWMKDGDAAGLTPLAVQSAGAAVMAAVRTFLFGAPPRPDLGGFL